MAARKGSLEKVVQLLNSGASPNSKDFAGLSPLFDACSRGFAAIVAELLKHDAHPNTPCGDQNDTPLHDAAFYGHVECMELLLKVSFKIRQTMNEQ